MTGRDYRSNLSTPPSSCTSFARQTGWRSKLHVCACTHFWQLLSTIAGRDARSDFFTTPPSPCPCIVWKNGRRDATLKLWCFCLHMEALLNANSHFGPHRRQQKRWWWFRARARAQPGFKAGIGPAKPAKNNRVENALTARCKNTWPHHLRWVRLLGFA